MSENDVTVKEIVEELRAIADPEHRREYHFKVYADGVGTMNDGVGQRNNITQWFQLEDFFPYFHKLRAARKERIRHAGQMAAEQRVIEAAVALVRVGDISGNALRMRALNEDLCDAVDALQSLGADHE